MQVWAEKEKLVKTATASLSQKFKREGLGFQTCKDKINIHVDILKNK